VIVLYAFAATGFLGSIKTIYDVWGIVKRKCQPPEKREEWDADSRLMLEQVYTDVILESGHRHQALMDALGQISDVITKEDSHGHKLIYYNGDEIRKILLERTARTARTEPRRYVRVSHRHSPTSPSSLSSDDYADDDSDSHDDRDIALCNIH
jgi:hypothetical protein